MKKREDMEWKLFELLEDELSASEEADILAQMENDEALEEEWSLLQSTKLTAPEVTYANKKSLLKKETTVLAFAGVKWLRYAAILAVVAGSYPLWKTVIFSNDVDGLVGTASEIVDPNHTTKTIEPGETVEMPADELQTPGAIETVASASDKTPLKTNASKQEVAEAGQSSGSNPSKLDKHKKPELIMYVRRAPEYVFVSPRTDVNGLVEASERKPQLSVPVHFSPEWFAQMDVVDDMYEQENNASDYRGIRPALNSGLAWIISPFKNSKVSVKPVPGNFKALQFTYSNSQYEATAMVSLTPIKD